MEERELGAMTVSKEFIEDIARGAMLDAAINGALAEAATDREDALRVLGAVKYFLAKAYEPQGLDNPKLQFVQWCVDGNMYSKEHAPAAIADWCSYVDGRPGLVVADTSVAGEYRAWDNIIVRVGDKDSGEPRYATCTVLAPAERDWPRQELARALERRFPIFSEPCKIVTAGGFASEPKVVKNSQIGFEYPDAFGIARADGMADLQWASKIDLLVSAAQSRHEAILKNVAGWAYATLAEEGALWHPYTGQVILAAPAEHNADLPALLQATVTVDEVLKNGIINIKNYVEDVRPDDLKPLTGTDALFAMAEAGKEILRSPDPDALAAEPRNPLAWGCGDRWHTMAVCEVVFENNAHPSGAKLAESCETPVKTPAAREASPEGDLQEIAANSQERGAAREQSARKQRG